MALGDWGSLLVYADTAMGIDRSNREALALRKRARAELQDLASREAPQSDQPGIIEGLQPIRRPAGTNVQSAAASVRELVPVPVEFVSSIFAERSPAELAELASSDPRIVSRLLAIANDQRPGKREYRSATEAVDALGTRQVRALALASVLADAFNETTVVSHRDFWRFSLVVGALADLLATNGGFEHDLIFAAGAVHNLGLLGLDVMDPDGVREVLAAEAVAGRRVHDRERYVFGFSDADLGAELARAWGFPEALVNVISSQRRDTAELEDREHLALSTYVVQARIFGRAHGLADGIESSRPRHDVPRPWDSTSIAGELKRIGGPMSLQKRYSAFLEAPELEQLRSRVA